MVRGMNPGRRFSWHEQRPRGSREREFRTHCHFGGEFHFGGALRDGVRCVTAFVNVVERHCERCWFVLGELPSADILFRWFGEDGRSTHGFDLNNPMPVSGDLPPDRSTYPRQFSLWRVLRALEARHRGQRRSLILGNGYGRCQEQCHEQKWQHSHAGLIARPTAQAPSAVKFAQAG